MSLYRYIIVHKNNIPSTSQALYSLDELKEILLNEIPSGARLYAYDKDYKVDSGFEIHRD